MKQAAPLQTLGTAKTTDILLLDANPYFPPIPPLGLFVLQTALSKASFESEVLSLSPFLDDYSINLDRLKSFLPRVIGLQIRNFDHAQIRSDSPDALLFYQELCARLRAWFPETPLILGGSGFSIDPQYWLKQLNADYGICGSGELPLQKLLEFLIKKKGDRSEIPNLVSSSVPFTTKKSFIPEKLERVYSTADFSSLQRYYLDTGHPLPWANIEIQRGCKFNCSFCVEPRIFGNTVIFKKIPELLAEVEDYLRQGISDFFFCNSEFNLDLDYCFDLCNALRASGLGDQIRWHSYLIPNQLPLKLAEAMKRSGCQSISFNAVHVNDDILKSFHCPHRRQQYEKCLQAAKAAGLYVSNTFLLGSHLETSQTVAELMAFIDSQELNANIGIGLAHYPNLNASKAFEIPPEAAIFEPNTPGGVLYSLNLSKVTIDKLEQWAEQRTSVFLENKISKQPLPSNWKNQAAALPAVLNKKDQLEADLYRWICQTAAEDNALAEPALAKLRYLVPLLDLPHVQLGKEHPLPVPPEPDLLLYGPYQKRASFYQQLQKYVALHAVQQPESFARLLLRLSRCEGEFPDILQQLRSQISDDAIDWLHNTWTDQHAFHRLVFATSYACQSKCPYCYAKDVEQDHPGELNEQNFLKALNWAARQNCQVISFVGGEPTLHPDMKKFLGHVKDYGMKTYFNSNLLCEPDTLESFDPSWVLNVGIHAQAYRYTKPELRQHFEENIRVLRQKGIYLFLRYNFMYPVQEAVEDAIELAERFGVHQVNFAVPMPALGRKNLHVQEEKLLLTGEFLVKAVETFRAAGLKPILSKPIPPCAVPEDKLEMLRPGEAFSPACNLPKRNWTQNVLVGPDLSISPCVGVSSPGPSLLSFDNFDEISKYMIGHLRQIVRPTPFPKCHNCNFYKDNRCLGGCLAYFTDGHQPTVSTMQKKDNLNRLGI